MLPKDVDRAAGILDPDDAVTEPSQSVVHPSDEHVLCVDHEDEVLLTTHEGTLSVGQTICMSSWRRSSTEETTRAEAW